MGRPARDGIHASSAIAKAFSSGNKVNNIPEELKHYATFIRHESNFKWIKWQIEGGQFIDLSEECPYCISGISNQKETIKKVAQQYEVKSVENLNKLVGVFNRLERYFSDNTKQIIRGFISNVDGYSVDEVNFLKEVRNQIDGLKTNFANIQHLSFISLKEVEKVKELLGSFKINLDLFGHLDSPITRKKVEAVNGSIDLVMEKAGELQGRVNIQKAHVEKLVKKNKLSINGFLKNAGYRYTVDLIPDGTGKHRLKLIHDDVEGEIASAQTHLSYGERNAFALVLFMFDALKCNPDLIILDDPISFFDRHKKYANMEMLFRSDESFRNRTVLMLSHDLEPIIDMVFHHSDRFRKPVAKMLDNVAGQVTEKLIGKGDIETFIEINQRRIANGHNLLSKLVYYRRKCEVANLKGVEFQLISNLFHKRDIPSKMGSRWRSASNDRARN